MAFGSNVAPRRRVYEAPRDWFCSNCCSKVRAWWRHCPSCNNPRG